jgi:rhodanese-related sulfurtransferase
MSQPRIIDVNELTAALRAGAVQEFWNALTDDYFRGELIPGSRRVAVDRVGREVAATGLAKDTAIVVYCSGPACPNSMDAGKKLVTLGFTNVSVFEGGLEAWKNSGRGVEVLSQANAA